LSSPSSASPTLADIYGVEDVPLVLEHLSHWWSVVQMQDLMTWLHTTVDLPWWGSIAAATVLLRLLAMPFEVVLLRNSLRMKQILPEVSSCEPGC
jgi:membrane protein insertase Oxa1/YidC/SpoIIIJ